MKNFIFLALLICVFNFSNCKTEGEPKEITTVLQGNIINRDSSKTLSLITIDQDWRTNPIKIPINNGKFIYTLKSKFVQKYKLAFKDELDMGSWLPIDFFNDTDTINFILHEREKYADNIINGGELNKKVVDTQKKSKSLFYDKIQLIYKTKVDSLRKINKWDSKEVAKIYEDLKIEKNREKQKGLYEKINQLREEKKDLTAEARIWQSKIDSIFKEYQDWQNNKITHDNSIYGYSLLMDKLYANDYDKTFNLFVIEENLENYQNKFNKHPYTLISKNIVKGIKNAKINGFYTDFSSKTIDDKIVKISPVINQNNLTLIDLWATWCGPCIAKSKALKPEYDKLHKKGLEVFAVIGGINKKEKYIEAREKYNYPWQVNYELNQEFKIWEKYNISNSGGKQFLVDVKGKILAINPKPKEIDSILDRISTIKI